MALIGAHTPGATPLTEEDIRGLKLASVTTQGELNEAEAQNILRGQEWALRSRTRALSDMLNDEYLLRLHQECSETCGNGLESFAGATPTLACPRI
jgi:fido (protein-threonine AMPylation protein)